ncbi:MAG TPA: glycosyltransferase family 4 protein [Polyangiaceae bacterium]|nr:glycosyltransferase family 4 protein [Polyangiaceae bacterium]
MRIVLTCNFSPWSPYSGGGQRSTHSLATALVREGHDVNVVFTRTPWERFAVPRVEYQLHWASFFGLKSRRAAPLRPLNALSVLGAVQALHQKHRLDVVHGNGEEVVLAAIWGRKAGVPVVTTPRYPNYPAPLLQAEGASRAAWLRLAITDPKYLLLGRAARASTWCCPTSEHAARLVERALGVETAKIAVIPNGVSGTFFEHEWTLPSSAPLLFFGRLAHDKGVDTLLQALARDPGERRLVVVGRGDQGPALRRMANELGLGERVVWRDWLDEAELALALSRCKLAVLPSRHESFGNAMAEAMAVGAPLVSTRAGSIPEIVEHEVTGLLVPPDDATALHQAITRLEHDTGLAQRLGSAGRQRMQASFSWPAIARRYARLYGERPRS